MRPANRARAIKPSARRATKVSARRKTRRTAPTRSRARTGRTRLSAKTTTDRQEIIRWTEERGGHPATVIRTALGGEPGILRIDFPGFSGAGTLKPISWDEWFQKFEERNLAFLYQDRTSSGKESRFFKLIERPSQVRNRARSRSRSRS